MGTEGQQLAEEGKCSRTLPGWWWERELLDLGRGESECQGGNGKMEVTRPNVMQECVTGRERCVYFPRSTTFLSFLSGRKIISWWMATHAERTWTWRRDGKVILILILDTINTFRTTWFFYSRIWKPAVSQIWCAIWFFKNKNH